MGLWLEKWLKHRKPHIGPIIKLWFPLQAPLFLCFPEVTEGLLQQLIQGLLAFSQGASLIRGNRPAGPFDLGFGADRIDGDIW